jgi:uncharacterized protein YprB with RNaseH-like and TPR domain
VLGFFDIECSGLVADFGMMLSWAIKELDGDIDYDYLTVADIDNSKDGQEDRRIVESLVQALSRYDRIITYYGNDYRFDVPFVRTKAVAMDIPFPCFGQIKHEDLYPIIKKKFRLSRNRQENAARTLLGTTEKNHVDGAIWRAAARGKKRAMGYIVDHNHRDVRDLERLYLKVINFVRRNDSSI